MADPEGTRKLEAILAADVAGYSRLMQEDDEATVATLEAYRAVFREKIQAHRGRVVDMAGDSVLAVFEAATGAVRAAFEIQGVLAERNEALPEARRMRFRIGVNLGEVIERPDGTVYGDGVNIAARLESIGEPGGVTVSGTVFDQVKNRVQVGFDFIGEQEVKNIAELVRAYRVVAEGTPVSASGATQTQASHLEPCCDRCCGCCRRADCSGGDLFIPPLGPRCRPDSRTVIARQALHRRAALRQHEW